MLRNLRALGGVYACSSTPLPLSDVFSQSTAIIICFQPSASEPSDSEP